MRELLAPFQTVVHVYMAPWRREFPLSFLIVRPFVIQSDLSVETAVSDWSPDRAFLHSRKISTEFSDWGIQSKKSTFSTRSASRKTQVEKVLHLFFEPIASLIPPQNTHPHAHTPIPGATQQYHTTARTLPWLSLLLLLAASQRGAVLALLASSMYHTTAVARVIDALLPTTAYACCSFGGFRLSITPPTRIDEGSSRVKHALLARNARSTELPIEFRAPYSSAPSHQPPLGITQEL